MVGLIVVFIDKKKKEFTVFYNQNSYFWTQIFKSLNAKEYTMKHFGGSRKEVNLNNFVKKLKSDNYKHNDLPIDFKKITQCV